MDGAVLSGNRSVSGSGDRIGSDNMQPDKFICAYSCRSKSHDSLIG
jgi:hypothetical protein